MLMCGTLMLTEQERELPIDWRPKDGTVIGQDDISFVVKREQKDVVARFLSHIFPDKGREH